MGHLYQRKQRDGSLGGPIWMQYYRDGQRIRESTETSNWDLAKKVLKDREGRVVRGEPLLPRAGKVLYEELRNDVLVHYETSGQRDIEEAGWRLRHLDPYFRGVRAASITGEAIAKYIQHRQAEKASNGSINRELGVLKRMLRLGYERNKVLRLPVVHLPKESAPRQGFFERDVFEAIRRHLPLDLQVAVTIAYTYGWRTQSEVLTLLLSQMDLVGGTLRLEPGSTKNGDGRIVYLTPELKSLLQAHIARVHALSRELQRVVNFLFPHFTKAHAPQGSQRKDFRDAWDKACADAGHAEQIRHDFRRTAVRNMVNAGIPEKVAMMISGHKTRAVFDRYHIVSPGDLQAAAAKLDLARAATTPATTATVTPLPVKTKSGEAGS